ncbi:MAG: VOC family protein, partial [Acidimicrobiales bacterium]
MSLRIQCIGIDCADPSALGHWWADVLGWRVTHEEDDEVAIEPPAGSREDGV